MTSSEIPIPYSAGIAFMIKTILREGGHVEMGHRKIVPRIGSGFIEPKGNFKDVCKHMAERGELVQYKPSRDIGMAYVWGMRGITPDICKDRDELMLQLEIASHKLDRAKMQKWISFHRHQPTHKQRIIAFVPVLANAGHVAQVVGRYDVHAGLVTVDMILPLTRDKHHVTVQYEFSHWMTQFLDPTD
jgi:hypothetical protein